MKRVRVILILMCLAVASLSAAGLVRAQAAEASPDETSAVRAAGKEYLAALRRNDVAALRRMWTPDGDYVDASGQTTKAQELFRDGPATPPANAAVVDAPVATTSLRFVTPDVAIEDGTIDGGVSSDGSAVTGRFTATWVKRDGRWLLDNLREAVSAAPTVNEHLQPLEWLIGEWAAKADDVTMLVSARWSEGNNFIVRDFLVESQGREVLTGTQRIGWDPLTSSIKSWVFDSHGGAGVGSWKRDGERWVVESEEVMADGKKSSASTMLTPGGAGSFVWEVKSAKVGDTNVPTRRIEFKRAAEE